MNTFKFVFNNLFRRKGRFVFTLLGISIGMAAFVALLSLGGNMRNEIEGKANALGASFIIVPEHICVYNQMAILTGNTITESLQYEVFERIAGIEGIEVIPLLTQKSAYKNTSNVVVGILPEQTKNFRKWEMAGGEYFSSPNENALIIGIKKAERLGLSVGDELAVRGETFKVKGILAETQSNDDETMFLPLDVVQRLYDKHGQISYMSAKISNMSKIKEYEAAILNVASVQVVTDRQLLGAALTIVNSVNVTLQLVALVSLIAAAFGIVNTMMTAIYERRKEIGILRAIGGKSSSIFKFFILESGMYGLFGGIIGVAVGLTVSVFVAPFISQDQTAGELLKGISPTANFDVLLIATTILLSVIIAILSGLYPSWRASKLTPMEAINYE